MLVGINSWKFFISSKLMPWLCYENLMLILEVFLSFKSQQGNVTDSFLHSGVEEG